MRIACLVALLFWSSLSWAQTEPSTEAPRVTLHVKDADPEDVLAQLSKLTGVTFRSWPPNGLWNDNNDQENGPPSITLDLDNASFWSAVSAFCSAAGVQVQNTGQQEGKTVTLARVNSGMGGMGGVMCASGDFAIVATNISRGSQIMLGTGQVMHQDMITFTIFADPRVRVYQMGLPPRIESIVDENGLSLKSTNNNQPSFMQQPFNGNQFQGGAQLQFPQQVGKKIASLKGSIRVAVVVQTNTFTIPDLTAAVGKTTSAFGRDVTVKSFKIENGQGSLDLTVAANGESPAHNLFSEVNPITLTDANGKSITVQGGGGGSDEEIDWQGSFTPTNRFGQPIAGWGKTPIKASWDIIVRSRRMIVPFEFKDLPIPPN